MRTATTALASSVALITAAALPSQRVHFAFENADIRKVMRAIGEIASVRVVVAPEVQATITLRLKDIPWRDALDAAAKTLGLVVVGQPSGVFWIAPPSSLRHELITRRFEFRHIRWASWESLTASEPRYEPQVLVLVRHALTAFGTFETVEGTNAIVVRDTAPIVEEVARIIQQIDVEPVRLTLAVKVLAADDVDQTRVHVTDADFVAKGETVREAKLLALDHHRTTIWLGDRARGAKEASDRDSRLVVRLHTVPGTDDVILNVMSGPGSLAPCESDAFLNGRNTGSGTVALPHVVNRQVVLRAGQTALVACPPADDGQEQGLVVLLTPAIQPRATAGASTMRRVLTEHCRQPRPGNGR